MLYPPTPQKPYRSGCRIRLALSAGDFIESAAAQPGQIIRVMGHLKVVVAFEHAEVHLGKIRYCDLSGSGEQEGGGLSGPAQRTDVD